MDIIAWARTNLPTCPPVIMLTSRADKDDVAAALNAGADDFIVKPESAIVITARVEALLRRTSAQPVDSRIETYGPYVFDRLDETVTLNGEPVVLTSKEFALARLFFANKHKPLSRRYLMETVWKSVAELSTRTLDMHVSRIRAKLNLRSDNGYRLQTVFGYGYRLESF
jgi:DNA-binding response OmpR family regulator